MDFLRSAEGLPRRKELAVKTEIRIAKQLSVCGLVNQAARRADKQAIVYSG